MLGIDDAPTREVGQCRPASQNSRSNIKASQRLFPQPAQELPSNWFRISISAVTGLATAAKPWRLRARDAAGAPGRSGHAVPRRRGIPAKLAPGRCEPRQPQLPVPGCCIPDRPSSEAGGREKPDPDAIRSERSRRRSWAAPGMRAPSGRAAPAARAAGRHRAGHGRHPHSRPWRSRRAPAALAAASRRLAWARASLVSAIAFALTRCKALFRAMARRTARMRRAMPLPRLSRTRSSYRTSRSARSRPDRRTARHENARRPARRASWPA